VALFGTAYLGFGLAGADTGLLWQAPWFVAAGIAIGCVESFGNLAASAIAGLLWTAISPRAAFIYPAGWMVLALAGLPTTCTGPQASLPI
jgi:hypothetical protein